MTRDNAHTQNSLEMLDATNRTRAAAEEPARKPATEVPMEAMASKQLAYMEEVARAKRNVQLANLRNTESEILLEMAKLNAQLEKVRIELFRTELEEKATAKEQLPGKSKEWRELSAAEARAARALGFNEDSWQDGGSPEPCQKPWNKLAPSLASAATLLGYNEREWNEELEAALHELEDASTTATTAPAAASTAAAASNKEWADLNVAECNAATTLGFTKDSWDGRSPCIIHAVCIHAMYIQLARCRTAPLSVTLGRAPSLADGDSPPACMKRWSGLSGSERQAAEVLGYSQLAWERELEVELS